MTLATAAPFGAPAAKAWPDESSSRALPGDTRSRNGSDSSVSPGGPDDLYDRRLLTAIQEGLPLVSRPYAEIGRRAGLTESQVIARLSRWIAAGIVKRLGVVVRHRELGYEANAMVVFDVPDERVGEIGRKLSRFACVTLCYRRPRRGETWPYNLFCMIHGKDRAKVEAQVDALAVASGVAGMPRAVLFSGRCFKQRGARYGRDGGGSGD